MKHERQFNGAIKPWYLLFWPVFALRYLLVEYFNPADRYYPVRCGLDDRIPFLEVFVIPYVLWYICILGMHLWLYARRDPVFRQYSLYLIFTTIISTLIFLLYPTCQNLRPDVFPRNNILTDMVSVLYCMDTNTNVFPSEHVIGSAGVFLAAVYSDSLSGKGKTAMGIVACLSASATVFLKQHSVLDVLAAVPVCAAGWYISFYGCKKNSSRKAD